MSLTIYGEDRVLGKVTVEPDGTLAGSSPAVQEMVDSALANAGGDPVAAYTRLAGYGNGYIQVEADDDEDTRAVLEPRESPGDS